MSDKRKAQSRKLLQAAYDLVAEVGVSGLRTRAVAERAGVNIATLHYCFAGKDALLEALYVFIRDKFGAEFRQRLEETGAPEDKIALLTDISKQFLREEAVSLVVWRAFIGEAWTNPVIREIVRRHLADQRERLADILSQGRATGAFPSLPSADDSVNASLMMALYDGMLFQAAMDPTAFLLDDYGDALHVWLGIKADGR